MRPVLECQSCTAFESTCTVGLDLHNKMSYIVCFMDSREYQETKMNVQFSLLVFQVAFSLEGRTWALAEIPNLTSNLVRPSPVISDTWPDPPAVVKQHFLPPRTFVVLSAQVGQLKFNTIAAFHR